jgi:PKD repeat protein
VNRIRTDLFAVAGQILRQPVASFSASPTTGVAPLSVQFTDTSSGGQVTSRSWNFGDGQTSTLTNPTHLYTAGGAFTATLTVSGPGGIV